MDAARFTKAAAVKSKRKQTNNTVLKVDLTKINYTDSSVLHMSATSDSANDQTSGLKRAFKPLFCCNNSLTRFSS